MALEEGTIVRYEDRLWLVGMVNQSRARLDPISGTIKQLLTAQFTTYGTSVNVSPDSVLAEVTDEDLNAEEQRRLQALQNRQAAKVVKPQRKERTMSEAAVAQPTVSPNKQANKQRLADLAAKKKAEAAQKQETKAAASARAVGQPAEGTPTKPKTVRPCVCGCGEQVSGYFSQGHDARFKGWLLQVERGKMAVKDLPPVVQKSFEWVKKGKGYVPTKNYKGEPHTGYDKAAK